MPYEKLFWPKSNKIYCLPIFFGTGKQKLLLREPFLAQLSKNYWIKQKVLPYESYFGPRLSKTNRLRKFCWAQSEQNLALNNFFGHR